MSKKAMRRSPTSRNERRKAIAAKTMQSPTYVIAFDCGHRMWETTNKTTGIDWCANCGGYVGLIVARKPNAADY